MYLISSVGAEPDTHSTGRLNPSLELSCRHPGDSYPFHGGLGLCMVNSYKIMYLQPKLMITDRSTPSMPRATREYSGGCLRPFDHRRF
jgi:hypothetical protein